MKISTLSSAVCVVLALGIAGCKKKKDPETVYVTEQNTFPGVSTSAPDSVDVSSAVLGGVVSSEGNSALTAVGLCWDTKPAPTTLRSRIVVGVGTGDFRVTLGNLKPGTTYYVRAYATNALGTAYGNEVSFKTLPGWIPVNTGLQLNRLYANGNRLFGTMMASSTIRFSDNGGVTWAQASQSPNSTVTQFATWGNTLFCGSGSGMYRSTDNGVTWTTSNGSSNIAYQFIQSLAVGNNALYAGAYSSLYKSTDNGDNWTQLPSLSFNNTAINCLFAKGTLLFAGTASKGVMMSSDGGQNWNQINAGMQSANQSIQAISVIGGNLFVAASDGVYTSTNDGANWTLVSALNNQFSGLLGNGKNGAAWNYNYMYISLDNGVTWKSTGLGNSSINAVCSDGAYFYASNYLGLYKLPLN